MTRRVRVQRSVEEKWEIVEEGLWSGNIAETCRRYEIAPQYYSFIHLRHPGNVADQPAAFYR